MAISCKGQVRVNIPHSLSRGPLRALEGSPLGLYKRFVYLETVVHESTFLAFPPPACIAHPGAILLHDDWTVYGSPSDLPCVCHTLNNIGNNNIVQRPSLARAKGVQRTFLEGA